MNYCTVIKTNLLYIPVVFRHILLILNYIKIIFSHFFVVPQKVFCGVTKALKTFEAPQRSLKMYRNKNKDPYRDLDGKG